jgi:hypothetical protein
MKAIKKTGGTNDLPQDSGDTVYSISDIANSNANVFGTLVSRTSQDMYAALVNNTSLRGCKWVNGSTAWQDSSGNSCASGANYDSIATVTSGISNNISAVADSSGNVHLLYIDGSGYTSYQEYTSAWQTVVTLDGNSGNHYASITLDTSDSGLYAFWIRSDHIYYKHGASPYASGNWDASATDWHSGTTLTNLTSNYTGNAQAFAEWTSGSGSPYSINWDIIAVPENLWLFFSLGIVVPFYVRKKRKKILAVITRKY